MDVGLRLEQQLIAVESEHELFGMIELTAPPPDPDGQRPPLRLAVALDRSGSMGGAPLDTVKRCARFLLDQLAPEDELCLVAFDDDAELVVPLGTARDEARARIGGIVVGGMTNLSGGWLKAVEELERRDDGTRRVLLLSDGHANRGITDRLRLSSLAGAKSGAGIGTSTIGVGEGFDELLLSGMAGAGGGADHFAETIDDVPAIFAEEFEGLVALVAQNVSVEVRPREGVVEAGILNDYPVTLVEGGIQAQVGDLFGGQTVRVVFRLVVPGLTGLGLHEVAEVVVRYVHVGEQVAQHTTTHTVVVNAVNADEAAQAQKDGLVRDEVTILAAARDAQEAHEAALSGDHDRAQRLFASARDRLKEVPEDHPNAALIAASIERFDETAAMAAPSPMDLKRAHASRSNLNRRRRGGSS